MTGAFVKVISQTPRILLGISYMQQTEKSFLETIEALAQASFALQSALLQKPSFGYVC